MIIADLGREWWDPAGLFTKDEPKKDTPVFCPPGMIPNPQWAMIPAEAKAQAAASGVQACLPTADEKKKPKKIRCYFGVGARKYKCDQGDFSRARARALRAALRTGRPGLITLHVGSRTVSFRPWSARLPGARPGTAPVAPQPLPQGGFSCPAGTSPAQDQVGNLVCAPPSALPVGPAAPRRRRERRIRGRRGRRMRFRGIGDGLGAVLAPPAICDPEAYKIAMAATTQMLEVYRQLGAPSAFTERVFLLARVFQRRNEAAKTATPAAAAQLCAQNIEAGRRAGALTAEMSRAARRPIDVVRVPTRSQIATGRLVTKAAAVTTEITEPATDVAIGRALGIAAGVLFGVGVVWGGAKLAARRRRR